VKQLIIQIIPYYLNNIAVRNEKTHEIIVAVKHRNVIRLTNINYDQA